MPQRMQRKSERLDTTISRRAVEKIDDLARSIERSGRRYEVSRTEVVELAIDWMFGKVMAGRSLDQPDRDSRRDLRVGFKLATASMAKLTQLGKVLMKQDGYVHPPRSRPGEPSLGEAIDWCVAHFHGSLKGDKNGPARKVQVAG